MKKKQGIYAKFFKRFFDFLLSLVAVVILSPVFLIISIFSLIFLHGKVIFKQYRPGKNGKIFAMYKFRSMTEKKGPDGELLPDNLRITKWGKFLRKTSLDELPQLINILKGDMSIIGPRPRLIKDMIFYDDEVIKSAYSVRPGLTGPAQVFDRNSEDSWEEVFKRDIEYSNHITFFGDMKLFFGTFLAVFKGKGEGANSKGEAKEKREYYYSDQLLKDNSIDKNEYDEKLKEARDLENLGKGTVVGVKKDSASATEQAETKSESETEEDRTNGDEQSVSESEKSTDSPKTAKGKRSGKKFRDSEKHSEEKEVQNREKA